MNPLQRWMFACAACLAVAHAVGVPHSELQPVAWVMGMVAAVGLVATLADGERS